MDPINVLRYLIYLPFIGWVAPMALMDQDLPLFIHIKQSFVMAVIVTIAQLFFFGIMSVFPNGVYWPKMIVVILMYLVYFIYGLLSVFGTVMIVQDKKYNFPAIDAFMEKIKI
jgi:hypothetical protein